MMLEEDSYSRAMGAGRDRYSVKEPKSDDVTAVPVSTDTTTGQAQVKTDAYDPMAGELNTRAAGPAPERPLVGRDGKPEERQNFGDMQEVIDWLEARKAAIHLPSKEELEKERRRRRTEGIISSLADGASAVSNLISTTQYAPDMYRHENSMTEQMRSRYDRLKRERDADADRYLNYALMIGKLKEGQKDREYQRGRNALQDQIRQSQEIRAQLKADRDAAMAELKMQLLGGKISEQEASARTKEIEQEYADEYYKARVDEVKSRTSKNNRWQPSGSRGGSGSGGRHPWRDDKGVFGTKGAVIYENSEKGAREMARIHGGTYMITPTRSVKKQPDKWGDEQVSETVHDTSSYSSEKRPSPTGGKKSPTM